MSWFRSRPTLAAKPPPSKLGTVLISGCALLIGACGPVDRPVTAPDRPPRPTFRGTALPPNTSQREAIDSTSTSQRTTALIKDGTINRGRRVNVAGLQGVVLDPDAFVFAEGVDSWFEPSVEEIERVEEALGPALRAVGRAGPQIAQSLPDYRRQYAGLVRGGRRLVAINAFCRAHWPFSPDWERTQVIAFGGGSCFWYAEFDASTGEPVLIDVTGG